MSDERAAAPRIVGEAVLRDYPLRLWMRQQEHTDALMREFTLLLGGHETGLTDSSAPAQLVSLAEMFTTRFGGLIDAINAARQEAFEAGLDRMDSRVPLPEGADALMEQVRVVLEAVDEYCRNGDLLTLQRPPELIALADWLRAEIIAQYRGAEPTPWPGPF